MGAREATLPMGTREAIYPGGAREAMYPGGAREAMYYPGYTGPCTTLGIPDPAVPCCTRYRSGRLMSRSPANPGSYRTVIYCNIDFLSNPEKRLIASWKKRGAGPPRCVKSAETSRNEQKVLKLHILHHEGCCHFLHF